MSKKLVEYRKLRGPIAEIADKFFAPLAKHRYRWQTLPNFIGMLFSSEVKFEVRLCVKKKGFRFGGQKENTPRGKPDIHRPHAAIHGDLFTARFNPELDFIHVEVNNLNSNTRGSLYRCTPDQWEMIKNNTLSREEMKLRQGSGHDALKRNIRKFERFNFSTDNAARLAYTMMGKIKDDPT